MLLDREGRLAWLGRTEVLDAMPELEGTTLPQAVRVLIRRAGSTDK